MAAFSTAGALGAIAFAVAREVDTGVTGIGGLLQGLLTGQTWPVITGLGALAAAAYALVRRPAADFAFALAGACLALMAGVTNAAAFGAAVAPVPWPPAVLGPDPDRRGDRGRGRGDRGRRPAAARRRPDRGRGSATGGRPHGGDRGGHTVGQVQSAAAVGSIP